MNIGVFLFLFFPPEILKLRDTILSFSPSPPLSLTEGVGRGKRQSYILQSKHDISWNCGTVYLSYPSLIYMFAVDICSALVLLYKLTVLSSISLREMKFCRNFVDRSVTSPRLASRRFEARQRPPFKKVLSPPPHC